MEKLKVLVVDDDREIVDSIAIFLRADGYEIEKAYNGLEALDIVMTHTVHLIILDIMMPELDGIKTLLKLRESRNIRSSCSAKSEDADKILGLTAGADDYVTKPFNPSELVARVKSQLRPLYAARRDAENRRADRDTRSGARYREQKRNGGWRGGAAHAARVQDTGAAVPPSGQGLFDRGDLPAGLE